MTAPHDAQGTELQRGDGASPESFATVPRLTTIGTPGSARPLRDITDLSNTIRQHKLGLKDMPEMSCEGFYVSGDTEQGGLKSDHDNGTVRNYRIRFTDVSPPEVWDFSALVTAWNAGAQVDGDVPFNFTLKPQSDITIS